MHNLLYKAWAVVANPYFLKNQLQSFSIVISRLSQSRLLRVSNNNLTEEIFYFNWHWLLLPELSRGNTSPRRSSRLWRVFVFCFPENTFLRNAGLSTSLPHCRQMFSGTATRIKVLVGVFSSSIPLPNHWPISRGAKSILTVWQAALHAASWEVRAKMTSLDVILCKGNKSSFHLLARSRFALGARTIVLRAHCRATRSKAGLVSKSMFCLTKNTH